MDVDKNVNLMSCFYFYFKGQVTGLKLNGYTADIRSEMFMTGWGIYWECFKVNGFLRVHST